eukprot:299903-Amphidinium_carterae.3
MEAFSCAFDQRGCCPPRVSFDGFAFASMSAALKQDREIVLVALAEYGRALQHAATECKSDRDIVLAAVAKDGKRPKWRSL